MLERLAAEIPDIAALRGDAQNLPLASGIADTVICAQAFHWFATPAAVAEIHRVLRPGGVLGSAPYVTRAYWCISQELHSTTENAAEAAASVIV